jgi:ethanolamine-phosphate cytidylyltransferase
MSPVQRPIAAVREFLEDPKNAAQDAARSTITHARALDLGLDAFALLVIDAVRDVMDRFFGALGLLPTTDFELATAMSILVVGATLLAYFALFGKKHGRDRQQLRKELAAAAAQMRLLQELIDAEDYHSLVKSNASGKPVRIFVEGAFDVMHYGHANAFRQVSMSMHLQPARWGISSFNPA